MSKDISKKAKITLIASDKNWIEGDAIQQLESVAQLPGMHLAVGLPDLHPGRGHPIGAAFFSQGYVYPHLVGNDIGCGMGLWQSDLPVRKLKLDKWLKKLSGLEDGFLDTADLLEQHGLNGGPFDSALGTIGGGNHFAELQQLTEVHDPEVLAAAGLDPKRLVLLVHSGSRGLGESILREHIEQHQGAGLATSSRAFESYLERHNQAVAWARVNRLAIQARFLEALGSSGHCVLDVCHNSVTPQDYNGQPGWLHRKGAAPADRGLVVIPGSRGSLSYLVEPRSDAGSGWSVAHGAGRKWKRSESKGRLRHLKKDELKRTDLGSWVICENKNLLYEEAPQAYKNIDRVVQDLVDAGYCRVVAVLKPLITYKTERL